MSRASKHLEKYKKKHRPNPNIPVYCTQCGAKCGEEFYKMKNPYEYVCKMCNKIAFPEIRNFIAMGQNKG